MWRSAILHLTLVACLASLASAGTADPIGSFSEEFRCGNEPRWMRLEPRVPDLKPKPRVLDLS
jgi:hypothetical protein